MQTCTAITMCEYRHYRAIFVVCLMSLHLSDRAAWLSSIARICYRVGMADKLEFVLSVKVVMAVDRTARRSGLGESAEDQPDGCRSRIDASFVAIDGDC